MSSTRSARRSTSGKTRRRGCSSSRASRAGSCDASRPTSWPRKLPDAAGRAYERMTKLLVRRLHDEATLPARAYEHDAGLDLAAYERVELGPGERALVGTGLTVAIPAGHAGFVQPRSGLAIRHGITVLNTPGLVDAGYRGELKIVLLNTDRSETFVVEPGMRIAQLVVVPVATPDLVEVDELPDSERGEKGFGSSAH